MKKLLITAATVAVLGLAVLVSQPATPAAGSGSQELSLTTHKSELQSRLLSMYTLQELRNGVYVGSEVCIACHQRYDNWRDTKHANALRQPRASNSLVPGAGVVADYDGNGVDDFLQGLDFNQISSVFNRYKPNAPVLSFSGGTYFVTIGQLTMPVVATSGGTGDWRQQYIVRVPVSGTSGGLTMDNYVSPIQYNEVPDEYEAYRPELWWDEGGNPRFGPGASAAQVADVAPSYTQQCIGCHTTGIRRLEQDGNGEWRYEPYPAGLFDPADPSYFDYNHDGQIDILSVGCEMCHGPGSAHVVSAGDVSEIVNPTEVSTERANEICGQCHARVESVPGGVHDWPYRDDEGEMWTPRSREPLEAFFTDASVRWPDGVHSKENYQQWLDFIESPKPGFQFHPVVCYECHDPHGFTSNEHAIRDRIVDNGLVIATDIEDNTLCLACHATHGPFADITPEMVADPVTFEDQIEDVVEAHSNHPYAPERLMGLSRCTECHMPKVAESAVPYDIASHVFEAIPPEKTLRFEQQGGMPNSCAVSCHGTKVDLFELGLDPDITDWDQNFDKRNARLLEIWFGPGGIWWDTAESGVTHENLLDSARPGDYQPPGGYDD